MEWAQLPVVQLGAIGVLLAVIWMIFRGYLVPHTLVPRTTLEDIRKDRDERIAQTIRECEARVAEANDDAEQWRRLYESECQSHAMTRQAQSEDLRATLLASTESAQIAAALLTELRTRQIEAGS